MAQSRGLALRARHDMSKSSRAQGQLSNTRLAAEEYILAMNCSPMPVISVLSSSGPWGCGAEDWPEWWCADTIYSMYLAHLAPSQLDRID